MKKKCEVCSTEKIFLSKDATYIKADGKPDGSLRQLKLREKSNWWKYEELVADGTILEVIPEKELIEWSAEGTDGSNCPLEWEPVFIKPNGAVVAYDPTSLLFAFI